MKTYQWLGSIAVLLPLFLAAGCKDDSAANKQSGANLEKKAANTATDQEDEEAKIQSALADLSPEDRRLADEQKYCPVMPDARLGSMGPPFKITVKDQPVFLCCKTCRKRALKDPDKILAKVKELKAKAPGSPES